MKKIGIVTMIILLCISAASAQKYYARLGVGVDFGLGYYLPDFGDKTTTTTTDMITMKSSSVGTGLNINLGAGYMFSKYIGVDLGFNEFIGFGVKTKHDRNTPGNVRQVDEKVSASMFQVIPALVITPGLEKFNPYGRFGLILGLMNRIKYQHDETSEAIPEKAASIMNSNKWKKTDRGGVAIGYSVAVGADYNLSEKLSLYAEIIMNGLTYSPTKGKYDEWTVNGIDQLPLAPTIAKEWEYKKECDEMAVINTGNPNQMPKKSFTFTNVGINIGLKFRFGSAN